MSKLNYITDTDNFDNTPLGRKLSESTARVIRAIDRTKLIQNPKDYWVNMLASRSEETALGSYYCATPITIRHLLEMADWEEYSHPNVAPGCVAFIAPIQGFENVIQLDELNPESEGILQDPKGTGMMEFHVTGERGRYTDRTVIILGQHEEMEVVYTFHPGLPVRPSTVPTDPDKVGKTITVAEALEMGLTNAKIVIAR